jgi:nitrous oxide reductase
MEVNMTRRKMLLMTAGATVVGLAALVGFADHNAIFADEEDETQEALIKAMDAAKISLQQGLEASEQHGQPISVKFEIDEGKLQLSIYTAKDGKFSEVLVDYVTGKILKVEPIQGSDDLTAVHEQGAAMTKAKVSLKAVVDKTMSESANVRAVNVFPALKDGHPVASIDVLNYNEIRAIQQPLD